MTVPKNPPRTGRPHGAIGHAPTAQQMNDHRRELRKKANEGDVTALGFLVLAETLREVK